MSANSFCMLKESCHPLRRVHVVFGVVISGFEVIKKIEGLKTDSASRPYADARVMDCGQLITKSANDGKLGGGSADVDLISSTGREASLRISVCFPPPHTLPFSATVLEGKRKRTSHSSDSSIGSRESSPQPSSSVELQSETDEKQRRRKRKRQRSKRAKKKRRESKKKDATPAKLKFVFIFISY